MRLLHALLCATAAFVLLSALNATSAAARHGRAFATLVYNEQFVRLACGLGQSIRATHGAYDMVALAPRDVLPRDSHALLKRHGWTVREVDPLEHPWRHTALVRPGWRYIYCKLYVFALLEYDTVVYLDSDTLVERPIDALFDTDTNSTRAVCPRHCTVCAAPDITPSVRLNAGVLVVHRNASVAPYLLDKYESAPSSFLGEQALIARELHPSDECIMSQSYNAFVSDEYQWPWKAVRHPHVRHFLGWNLSKPYSWWIFLVCPHSTEYYITLSHIRRYIEAWGALSIPLPLMAATALRHVLYRYTTLCTTRHTARMDRARRGAAVTCFVALFLGLVTTVVPLHTFFPLAVPLVCAWYASVFCACVLFFERRATMPIGLRVHTALGALRRPMISMLLLYAVLVIVAPQLGTGPYVTQLRMAGACATQLYALWCTCAALVREIE